MYFYSEREFGWTFLDSVYYCFVALSTIGFGDLVPNQGKKPDSSYERGMWIVRLMYLGLGLSLLSSIFTSVLCAAKQIQGLMPCKRGKRIFKQCHTHLLYLLQSLFCQSSPVKTLYCRKNNRKLLPYFSTLHIKQYQMTYVILKKEQPSVIFHSSLSTFLGTRKP